MIFGGGIVISDFVNDLSRNTLLSGNIIKNNYNYHSCGGGVYVNSFGRVEFDTINKNSVFNNWASFVYDINIFNDYHYINVVLDTFTVSTVEPNFISMNIDYSFSCDNHIIENFINSDLFVDTNGSDTNDGLSPNTPFKTITKATYMIASDPQNPKTIHLAPGVYRRSV